jgi:general secretion pathway protein D
MNKKTLSIIFHVLVGISAGFSLLYSSQPDEASRESQNTNNGTPAQQLPESQSFNLDRVPLPSDFRISHDKKALQDIDTRKSVTAAKLTELDIEEEKIELNLEDSDLENFAKQIEQLFDVTFVPDDIVIPMLSGKKAVKGNKITFRSNKPLKKSDVWSFFLTALDLAGLALVPMPQPQFFRITKIDDARKSPIPVYIGVSPDTLPDNDQLIRFVYFIEEGSLTTIKNVIESLRSNTSAFLVLNDLRAFVLTDKAYNIRSLMKVVAEFDRVIIPETMSVIKLRQADAADVKALYESITQTDSKNPAAKLMPARKQPTTLYFPENVRIIADTRLNTLILLGPTDAVAKIETFIREHVDKELDQPYSPLRTYPLKFADARTVADIMNQIVQFGGGTEAGKNGGVRGVDKFLRPMTFTAEPETNQLVIRGQEEDYLQVKEIIEQLDEQQPQIAVEVLILSIDLIDTKQLGTQLRNREQNVGTNDQSVGTDGLLGANVTWQNSGINLGPNSNPQGIVTNPSGSGVQRLLGDLVNLAVGSVAGNTVITLGNDAFGVWGIFQVLQTISDTQIVANPFLVATNKKKASVKVGTIRRVVSGTVISGTTTTESFTNWPAELEVTITPQINSDGMIVLDLVVRLDSFVNPTSPTDATTTTRSITTTTILADKEVLALGGLIQNTTDSAGSKLPVIGDIPVLGWLFKNRGKTVTKDNLLILLTAKIMKPDAEKDTIEFTQRRVNNYQQAVIAQQPDAVANRDPINRLLFAEREDNADKLIDDFIFKRQTNPSQAVVERKSKKKRKRKKNQSMIEEDANSTAIASAAKVTPKPIENSLISAIPTTHVKVASSTEQRKNPSLTQLFSEPTKEETV